jgi:hypothetical protein
MTHTLAHKEFFDLTAPETNLVIEAHEMASFAYDMVNEILEFKGKL